MYDFWEEDSTRAFLRMSKVASFKRENALCFCTRASPHHRLTGKRLSRGLEVYSRSRTSWRTTTKSSPIEQAIPETYLFLPDSTCSNLIDSNEECKWNHDRPSMHRSGALARARKWRQKLKRSSARRGDVTRTTAPCTVLTG